MKISKSQEEAADRQANINELLVAAGKYKTGQRFEVDPWTAEGDLLELEEGEDEQDQDKEEEGEVEAADIGEAGGAALPSGALQAMLEDASLLTGEELGEEAKEKQNMVFLMTIHASKGLEFDTVFLTGVEEGCLPITREPEDRKYDPRAMGTDLTETEAVKEERRLPSSLSRAPKGSFLTHRQRMSVSLGADWGMSSKLVEFLRPLATLPKPILTKMKWKSPE